MNYKLQSMTEKNNTPPQKILLVRTDRLGDVVLSTPAIKIIKDNFPSASISFLCQPSTREVLEGNPYLDEVIICDKYGKHRNIPGLCRLIWSIRRKKFDWAIILHPTNRVHIIAFLAGIPLRIGWDKKSAFLLTRKLPHLKHKGIKHESEYNLDILKELGLTITSPCFYFPNKESATQKVNLLLQKQKALSKKLVAVHPSASCASKRWPQIKFIRLIRLIKNDFPDVIIALLTSEKESQFADKIAEEKEILDLRGKLSIPEIGALLKKSILFISNDSGPVHISAALDTPVISIFGRNDPGISPRRWKPLGRDCFYLKEETGCQPCLAHNCTKNFLCLQTLTAERVYSLAKKIISSSSVETINSDTPL
ncbi:MAG: hypothetical protein GF375_06865 [Candidatus Omnitrophica bacterium]|nr:hypothetical protein [Candidatus Omnitrophota bacterium]MBD3269697.1 hypothetical protein [Candidatus Omnitrophota bacterium]